MEMAMNMGAFEALNDDELMLVDGGLTGAEEFALGMILGFLFDGLVKASTGKTCADWISDGMTGVANFFSNL